MDKRIYLVVLDWTTTRRIFKIDCLENKASRKNILFYIFDLFRHDESSNAHYFTLNLPWKPHIWFLHLDK